MALLVPGIGTWENSGLLNQAIEIFSMSWFTIFNIIHSTVEQCVIDAPKTLEQVFLKLSGFCGFFSPIWSPMCCFFARKQCEVTRRTMCRIIIFLGTTIKDTQMGALLKYQLMRVCRSSQFYCWNLVKFYRVRYTAFLLETHTTCIYSIRR